MDDSKKAAQGLVEDIYATALGEQPWDAALHGIRLVTGARMAGIVTLDAAGLTSVVTAAADDSEWVNELQQSYNNEFYRYDPAGAVVSDWGVGRWYDDRRWNLPPQRAKSIYHQEFLLPRGIGYWEGVFVLRSPEVAHFLSLQGAFDRANAPSSRCKLGDVESHLGRALRMQTQLEALQGKLGEIEAALETLSSPLFLLDESRRLLRTNAAGRALMKKEPSLRFVGEIFSPHAMSSAGWRIACNNGVLALPRKPPLGPLVLTLNPLPARAHLARDWQRPLTLMLTSGERSAAERQRNLCVIFGLTQAEAEVCSLICTEGLSPQACSDARGVSIGTIRSQIKAIHLKTGVGRIAELVRLVASI